MQINQKLLTIVAKSQAAELQKQVTAEVEKNASAAGVSANSVDTTSIVNELLAANKDATIYSIADELASGYAAGLTVKNNGKTETASPNASSLASCDCGKTETANTANATDLTTSNISGGKIEYADDIGEKIASDLKVDSQYSVTFTDLTESEIYNIKKIIYDLHHKKTESGGESGEGGSTVEPGGEGGTGGEGGETVEPGGEGGTGGEGGETVEPGGEGGTEGEGSETEEPEEPKSSFISEFDDVESMFEWLNSQDSTISASTGLTRAQLVELSHNDVWEDANYDFFGSINRVFDSLDNDDNGVLSVAELKTLIGEELGATFDPYKLKVELYANQLQSDYAALSDMQKLDYIIERTREYLEAAGLTAQLNALNRLLSETDTQTGKTIKRGQIGFMDVNPGFTGSGEFTLGYYQSASIPEVYDGKYDITTWGSDSDSAGFGDLGLTLDIRLLSEAWYTAVDTLVHELTHATAYQYSLLYETGGQYDYTLPSQAILDQLHDIGALSDSDYSWYTSNRTTLDFNSEEYERLKYLCSAAGGEYMAYQTDADYIDSIAGDIYKSPSPLGLGMAGAVNGDQEKDAITAHINAAYDTNQKKYDDDGNLVEVGVEAVPDWKWWTYA